MIENPVANFQEKFKNPLSEEEFKGVLFDVARVYCPFLGVDFDNDVCGHLDDVNWWKADYGQASKEGKSIGMSAKDALRCLVDTHRTYQLYQGIRETIGALKAQRKEELVGIDAGTGTGILSILMVSCGVGKVHAIEVNEETFEVTRKFLQETGLAEKIEIVKGDATVIDLPELEKEKADILVSENLSGGLLDEPQYDIIHHLSDFLTPEAQIIPNQAELYASVAYVDWEGLEPGKNNMAERRLKPHYVLSDRVKFAEVNSAVNMPIPQIRSQVGIPVKTDGPINALLISTRFKINGLGQPVYLEPDTAQFLGKTSAFKLEDTAFAQNGSLNVSLNYETGRERKFLNFPVSGNNISLVDTMLK